MDEDDVVDTPTASEDQILDDMFEDKAEEETPESESTDEGIEEGQEAPEEVEEEKEEEGGEEAPTAYLGRPTVKEINAKYPDFFKTFPDLRHAFFREQKFSEIYPTVAQAQEAAEKARTFEILEASVEGGDPKLIIDSLAQTNEQALDVFAQNFLPSLAKRSPQAYKNVMTPVLQGLLRTIATEAQAARNQDLFNSVTHINHFLFQKAGVPDAPPPPPTPQQKQVQIDPRFPDYHAEVTEQMGQGIELEIEKAVPKSITGLQRKTAIREIRERLQSTLGSSGEHVRMMNALWDEAQKQGFPRHHKPRLVTAFLGRAKRLIPAIRSQVLGDVGVPSSKVARVIPSTSAVPSVKRIDPKTVNYRKMSDDDILNDKIVLKGK